MTLSGVAAMLLPSCNDVLGDLYDEPAATSEYGFVEVCTESKPGLIYINTTDYTTWTYIDFENRTKESMYFKYPSQANRSNEVHR